MRLFRNLSLLLFLVYLAVFPGSTVVVMLDRVPAWGTWMGGALLMLQGAIVLCWLLGSYGRRGALAALLIAGLAWAVEHVGVTTGAPFGRYRYTDALQPQLLGVVPLAIPCAWLMVALGAWQLASYRWTTNDERRTTNDERRTMRLVVGTATLVLLLDLQIETVATAINRYWIWIDVGPYYGVPLVNFAAWWVVGAVMALIVAWALAAKAPNGTTEARRTPRKMYRSVRSVSPWLMLDISRLQRSLPAWLYLLSTLMFSAVNLARGYGAAGLVGLGVLLGAALISRGVRLAPAAGRAAHRTPD